MPTVASAIVLVITMSRARSPWALPAVLVALPAAFYAVLLATGTSLAEAQAAGWALQPQVGAGGCLAVVQLLSVTDPAP